jgi:nicotinate-nucleotide--dimethylbenzimidazole phosphoribosyltransferase
MWQTAPLMQRIRELVAAILPVDDEEARRAEDRQRQLTKPPGSLGRLETLACRLAAIQRTAAPRVHRPRVIVFAADHGHTAVDSVAPYPREVTAQMVANIVGGGAAINALAAACGATVEVVDVGVAGPLPALPSPGAARFVAARVRAGTADIRRGPAMSETECVAAILAGAAAAERAASDGVDVVGLGEMGIGNSTAASAITAALTGGDPAAVTGPGTGSHGEALARKIAAVRRALEVNAPGSDPFEILRRVGGLEIAALAGLCLGASARGLAVVVDGFIATAGAALAVRMCPRVRERLFAAHRSSEPGHGALLDVIGQPPLLALDMRLGEGTGAALAIHLLAAAARALTEMATFDGAGVARAAPAMDPPPR